MIRNARATLRDLARHRRDEEAIALRRLTTLLTDLTRRLVELREEIERAQLAARRRIGDAFERSVADSYLAGLREKVVELESAREEKRGELQDSRRILEHRVIRHRQMVRLHDAAEARGMDEANRREELRCDDLAAGGWHRVRGGRRS